VREIIGGKGSSTDLARETMGLKCPVINGKKLAIRKADYVILTTCFFVFLPQTSIKSSTNLLPLRYSRRSPYGDFAGTKTGEGGRLNGG